MLSHTHSFSSVLTLNIFHRKMNFSHIVSQLSTTKASINKSVLSPRLLYGETTQGFMTADYKPKRTTSEAFSRENQSAAQIRLLLSVSSGCQLLSSVLRDYTPANVMRCVSLSFSTRRLWRPWYLLRQLVLGSRKSVKPGTTGGLR